MMNRALSFMYSSGYWIKKHQAKQLGLALHFFLGAYHKLAFECAQVGKHRFAFVPKMHCIAHIAVLLKQQSLCARWCQNPISTTVQMQEDYIGRPARVSRRVDIRQIHRNVVSRTLILMQQAFSKADRDERHMDAYGRWLKKRAWVCSSDGITNISGIWIVPYICYHCLCVFADVIWFDPFNLSDFFETSKTRKCRNFNKGTYYGFSLLAIPVFWVYPPKRRTNRF